MGHIERISARQAMFIMLLGRLNVTVVAIPVLGIATIRQDAWLAALSGFALTLIPVVIVLAVGLKFPRCTVGEIAERLLGSILGKAVGILYCLFFLITSTRVITSGADFIKVTILPVTPKWFIVGLILITAVYAVFKGLEVFSRVMDLLFFPSLGFAFLLIIFLFKNMKLENLLPLISSDISTLAAGSLGTFGLNWEPAMMLMFIPVINKQTSVSKYFLMTIILYGIIETFTIIQIIAVLGIDTAKMLFFPLLTTIRQLQVADFITRVDAIFIATWMVTWFIKASIALYLAAVTLQKVVKTGEYQWFVWPIGALVFALSFPLAPSTLEFYMRFVLHPLESMVFTTAIPLLLLLLSYVKKSI